MDEPNNRRETRECDLRTTRKAVNDGFPFFTRKIRVGENQNECKTDRWRRNEAAALLFSLRIQIRSLDREYPNVAALIRSGLENARARSLI